jgi:hypothetical protein
MTFWSDSRLEPKRGYKFILSMPGGSATSGLREFLVKSVGKPQFEIGATPHAYLNHTFYYPGKTTWQPITAVVVDTVDPETNATQQIMKMLEESGYSIPSSRNSGKGTVSKEKAVNAALGQVKIKTLDSDGTIIEEWVLNNAFLQRAEFGELSYDNEELLNVTLTIQYDNAYIDVKTGGGTIPAVSS